MLKKGFTSGAIYLLIAVLFAIGAINKTISNDSIVLAMQWFCAVIFFVIGVLNLKKKTA
jgi:hypothetical protein